MTIKPQLPFSVSRTYREVMRDAGARATRDRTTLIDTGHLLVALAARPEVAALLRTVNASPAAVRRFLDAAPVEHPPQGRHHGRWGGAGATAEAEALLTAALMQPRRPRDATVADLLMVACRLPESRAGSVLERLGIESDDVRLFFSRVTASD